MGFTGTKKRGVPDEYFVLCTATAISKSTGFHRKWKIDQDSVLDKERQQYLCSLRDPSRITPIFNNTQREAALAIFFYCLFFFVV